jgi:Tfp pilus assembly protein PilO
VTNPAVKRKRWAVDHQQLLILLVSAVMVGSFVLLVFWPTQQQLSDLGSEVSRQRELVDLKMRTSQEGLYVSARIAALRGVQDRLGRRLPEDVRLAEFLESVDGCVRTEKGITHEIQRLETESAGPVPAAAIRLKLTGPFESVHRCLAQVEGLERLNRVQRLHVKRLDDAVQVMADAEIHIYYLPAEASGPAQRASVEVEPEVIRG